MKNMIYVTLFAIFMTGFANAQNEKTPLKVKAEESKVDAAKKVEKKAKVQIAILLDSSSSMNGLINQARAQLWGVVNTFIAAEVGGKVPVVQVALYTYGQSELGEKGDYIRQIQPLTRDLDQISADLFELRTTGSQEYCGTAIARATKDLVWDKAPNTYKAIFIAGNESFKQGAFDAEKACREAITKGIIVNTIFCGPEAEGLRTGWKNGAVLADGKFSVINQNKAMVHIDTPHDAKILDLNTELNKTYVTYNNIGKRKLGLQQLADKENEAMGKKSAVARSQTKASGNYWNASWDLVDASSAKGFDWSTLKEASLPKELQGLPLEKKKALVEGKRKQRGEIQKKIRELGAKRAKFIATKVKLDEVQGGDSLDTAMRRTVIEQAEKKGYIFKK